LLSMLTLVAVQAAPALPATQHPLSARGEPEIMAASIGAPTHGLRPRGARALRPLALSLDALPPSRTAALHKVKGPGPLQIGLGRPVDVLRGFRETATRLNWQDTGGGGKLAALSIASPEALGLRFALLIARLPAAATLRFYASSSDWALEVSGQTVLDSIAANQAAGHGGDEGRTYWSPLVEGSEAVLEIELPAGVDTRNVEIALPRISHLFAPIHSRAVTERSSGVCNLDVTCQSAWSNESHAEARVIFSTSAGSYLCSGTLLSDKDLSTSIPYFLSANHCIANQAEASTVQTYWFYRASACNSGSLYSGSRQLSGGATLLYASALTDTSFMRLNDTPPAGVGFAGWDSNLPATGLSVTGIHHPQGDLQKISFGTLEDYEVCSADSSESYSCTSAPASAADHYSVVWSSGVTEGGSSGSGLFLDTHYLIGTLHGGQSFCETPNAPDDYGRFDRAFSAALYQWLNKTDLSVVLTGSGAGTVTSAGAGIACGLDCNESYYLGESVTLTATPASGSAFSGWSGACSGSSPACSVTMDVSHTVSAAFIPASVPTTPSITAITRGATSAIIRFSLASDGGAPISGVIATCTAPGQTPALGSGKSSPLTVAGLARNVAYSCTLLAQNAVGTSAPSTAFTVPAKPKSIVPALMMLLD
jgi:hypothetical protein